MIGRLATPCRRVPLQMVFVPMVALLVGATEVPGAGLREFQDSWLIPTEDTWFLIGKEGDPLASILSPGRAVGVGVGRARLFSLPDLDQTWLTAMVRTRLLGRAFLVEGEWQRLGTGLYVENLIGLELRLGNKPGVGLGLARKSVKIGREDASSQARVHLQLDHLVRLAPDTVLRCRLALPLVAAESEWGHDSRREFLKVTVLRAGVALAIQIDRRFDGSPVLGFDFFWGPQGGWGFNLRIDPATGSLGPGFQFRRGILLMQTSHLIHPDLGQTHRFALSLRRSGG